MRPAKIIILSLVIAVLSGISGYFFGKSKEEEPKNEFSEQKDLSEVRSSDFSQYEFINPLLECDNFHPSAMVAMQDLESKLNKHINQVYSSGVSNHVSVYFRALNSGPWIGINENEDYAPASLLKVPVMIAVLKKSESDPDFLKRKITYTKESQMEFSQDIKADDKMKLGADYSIDELLEIAVINSDNDATQMLIQAVGSDFITKAIKYLGVSFEGKDLSKDCVSVKTYSAFFRILYNATYLSKETSEKALGILNSTKYKSGISRYLPKEIKVAHKFGERGFPGSIEKQLHDCGIVYLGDKPYLICIMTKGKDFNELSDVIADISKIVYDYVNVNTI